MITPTLDHPNIVRVIDLTKMIDGRWMPDADQGARGHVLQVMLSLPASGRLAKRRIGENMKPTSRPNGKAASANITKRIQELGDRREHETDKSSE